MDLIMDLIMDFFDSSIMIAVGYIGGVIGLMALLQKGYWRHSDISSGLSHRLSLLDARIEQIASSTQEISDAQRDDLVMRLRESIEKLATENFLEEILHSVKETQRDLDWDTELRQLYETTINRLRKESSNITFRGHLNLSLGILTALTGMGFLWDFVTDLVPSSGEFTFLEVFIPRFSFVIVIEVFAYFFLRLYSKSLMEVKDFQNEITNVEAKFFALRAAMSTGEERTVGHVISVIAETERNNILQKGQTTVDIERSRAEKETIGSTIESFLGVLSRKR